MKLSVKKWKRERKLQPKELNVQSKEDLHSASERSKREKKNIGARHAACSDVPLRECRKNQKRKTNAYESQGACEEQDKASLSSMLVVHGCVSAVSSRMINAHIMWTRRLP